MSEYRKPILDNVLKAIQDNRYDKSEVDLISDAISQRIAEERAELEKRVKELYGEQYQIVPKTQFGIGQTRGVQSTPPFEPVEQVFSSNGDAPEVLPEGDEEDPEGEYESRSPIIG